MRRIPRAVGAIEQPAEIRRERHQQRNRLAHRAGKMRDRRIDRDDEIEHRDDRGGVGKIVEFLAELKDAMLAQDRRLRLADVFLHADEIEAGHRKQRGKAIERHRAIAIVACTLLPAQHIPTRRRPLSGTCRAICARRSS